MKRRGRAGFSLVELLTVIMSLSVLAGVAVPLYAGSRRTSAARVCQANLQAIARAEAAYALRHGAYTDQLTRLAGPPEEVPRLLACPLRGRVYRLDHELGELTIRCPDAKEHAVVRGTPADYKRALMEPAGESMP